MIIPRLKAFAIDYMIIIAYALVLFGAAMLCSKIFGFPLQLENTNPFKGQLIGFVTLTLPVILYFTLSESGPGRGTIGKRKYHLAVTAKDQQPAGGGQLLLRNCIKFLPWETAHFFLHQLFYYTQKGENPPSLVLAGLIGAQLLAVFYLLTFLFTNRNRAFYEVISGTRVIARST